MIKDIIENINDYGPKEWTTEIKLVHVEELID